MNGRKGEAMASNLPGGCFVVVFRQHQTMVTASGGWTHSSEDGTCNDVHWTSGPCEGVGHSGLEWIGIQLQSNAVSMQCTRTRFVKRCAPSYTNKLQTLREVLLVGGRRPTTDSYRVLAFWHVATDDVTDQHHPLRLAALHPDQGEGWKRVIEDIWGRPSPIEIEKEKEERCNIR